MKRYTFRNAIEYLKDNPKNYWFKRRLYGWGWVPAKWPGWVFLLLWILILSNSFLMIDSSFGNESVFMTIQITLLVILLLLVCYGTGEKPKWSWGID